MNAKRNAKFEFLDFLEGTMVEVLAADVNDSTLYVDYTALEGTEFLDALDFEYDAGSGVQHVFGTIWFVDGTWAERGEYDGAEWWEPCLRPRPPTR